MKVSAHQKLISAYFMFWKDKTSKSYGEVLFIYTLFQKSMGYSKKETGISFTYGKQNKINIKLNVIYCFKYEMTYPFSSNHEYRLFKDVPSSPSIFNSKVPPNNS